MAFRRTLSLEELGEALEGSQPSLDQAGNERRAFEEKEIVEVGLVLQMAQDGAFPRAWNAVQANDFWFRSCRRIGHPVSVFW